MSAWVQNYTVLVEELGMKRAGLGILRSDPLLPVSFVNM